MGTSAREKNGKGYSSLHVWFWSLPMHLLNLQQLFAHAHLSIIITKPKEKKIKNFWHILFLTELSSLDTHNCSQTALTLSYPSTYKTRLFIQVIYSATKLPKATAPAEKHKLWEVWQTLKIKCTFRRNNGQNKVFLLVKMNREKPTRIRDGPKCQPPNSSLATIM